MSHLACGPDEIYACIQKVTYMIAGATWSPAYDIRVDIQTDIISCTYFGRVEQKTTEDWEGAAFPMVVLHKEVVRAWMARDEAHDEGQKWWLRLKPKLPLAREIDVAIRQIRVQVSRCTVMLIGCVSSCRQAKPKRLDRGSYHPDMPISQ